MFCSATSGLWRLRTHLTGVFVHTRVLLAFAFADLQLPHDSNLTITLLLQTLVTCRQNQDISESLYI